MSCWEMFSRFFLVLLLDVVADSKGLRTAVLTYLGTQRELCRGPDPAPAHAVVPSEHLFQAKTTINHATHTTSGKGPT